MTAVATRPAAGSPAPGRPAHRSGGRPLAGTGTLIRFILRRDRIKLPAWVLGITVLIFYYGAVLPEAFGSEEQLRGLGEYLEGPLGRMLGGPGYGGEDVTIAQVVVGVYGVYFLILAGLMNILLVSRHTRVDEQTGRAELVRASVVGRHAPLTAVLTVAVVANLLLALLVAGGMAANFEGGDALLFGVGVGAVGLVFAGITAITVQITEYSRAASGIAGAALGAAFVVRAAGDMIGDSGSPLSWFSPLAWSQQTKAYLDGRWWPLAVSVLVAVAAAAVGYALSTRRDLGASLVAARRGKPGAAAWLRSPFAFAFRLQRASLIGWTVGLVVAGALFGGITDEMVSLYETGGEEMVDVLGGDAENLTAGYLSVMGLFMALMAGIFVILGVQGLRGEESRGRAEPVLATATGRWAWFGSYLAVLAIGVVALLLLAGVATGAGTAIVTGEAAHLWEVTAAHLVYIPAVLVLLGLAALLFGVFPRAIGATWAVLGYGLFIGFFGALMDLPGWLGNLSPLEHIARMPAEDFAGLPLVILTLVAVALAGAGLAAFRRRDLETK